MMKSMKDYAIIIDSNNRPIVFLVKSVLKIGCIPLRAQSCDRFPNQ